MSTTARARVQLRTGGAWIQSRNKDAPSVIRLLLFHIITKTITIKSGRCRFSAPRFGKQKHRNNRLLMAPLPRVSRSLPPTRGSYAVHAVGCPRWSPLDGPCPSSLASPQPVSIRRKPPVPSCLRALPTHHPAAEERRQGRMRAQGGEGREEEGGRRRRRLPLALHPFQSVFFK